jgi:Protein of unknown function (DUF3307)
MTESVLTLAWLVLAHLVADFVLQTGWIVRAKSGHGNRALVGLATHGAVVALCLVPVGLAWGAPGWAFLVASGVLHVVIDRSKVLLTRRAALVALTTAHARHEGPQPAGHLGRAWTPWPAALFALDQLAHLAVAGLGWAILLAPAALQPGWTDAIDRLLGSWDRAAVHDVVSVAVVVAALAIANIPAASIFVAVLVRPVEQTEDETRWGSRAGPAVEPALTMPAVADTVPVVATIGPEAPRRWSLRLGPLDASLQAEPAPPPPTIVPPAPASQTPTPAQTARVGATIGILERILVVVFVLTGTEAAIGFVVAAKTLARFRLLDDRDFAEYYLLGTLASVAVAIVTALVGKAALVALLA